MHIKRAGDVTQWAERLPNMSNKAVRSKGNSSYQTPSDSPKPQKWAQPELQEDRWLLDKVLSLTSDRGHMATCAAITISKLMLPSWRLWLVLSTISTIKTFPLSMFIQKL